MAFRRTSFSALKSQKKEFFESIYKFSKKVPNFKEGSDVYVLPLGLEQGYYETPCHRILPHKVDGQTVGYGGSTFAVYVKCKGIDEEGNKIDSLCCQLAERERQRCGEDWTKRIIGSKSNRIHLPILILGNSIGDSSKVAYPITKVSILNDFKSEAGLKFSYLDMASSSFMNDIVLAYGRKLKEDGVLDYEMNEESDEFYDEVRERLRRTVIKIHGVSKQGFTAAMKEYSFFPFDNPTIASGSGEEERKAVTNYFKHKGIMAKVDEYLQLFNIEVENLIKSWNEKDLLEYYNSAIGVDIKSTFNNTPVQTTPVPAVAEEKVEVITPVQPAVATVTVSTTSTPSSSDDEYEDDYEDKYAHDDREAPSDAEMDALLDDPFEGVDPISEKAEENKSEDLDNFSYDMEEDESFFEE